MTMRTPLSTRTGDPIRLIVHGASGRMGTRIVALALVDGAFELVGAVSHAGSRALGRAIARDATIPSTHRVTPGFPDVSAHVVACFCAPAGVSAAIDGAERCGAALLVGTTAIADADMERLRGIARDRAVLVAPNTSIGIGVVSRIVARAAAALGPGYDVDLIESHHAEKKDAPSGTALRLARAARDAGASLPDERIHAIRAGDIIGEHTVRFAGPDEVIEITHRATNRDLFARGALRAASWLARRPAGWWTMDDLAGIEPDSTRIPAGS